MGRKKLLGLIVGVVTTALIAVGTRARAIKTPPTDYNPETAQNTNQKKVMGQKTDSKNQAPKSKNPATSNPIPADSNVSKILWSQNFGSYSGSTLNEVYWNVATQSQPIYNDEQQKYDTSSSNVRIEGGNLVLEARYSSMGLTSGRVDTKGKVKISPGSRLEARIKLPKGKGVWPAFWLLSDNQPFTARLNPTDLDWATDRFYLHDGEIDIMESYGSYPGIVEATVHTFAQTNEQQRTVSDEGYHNYWLEWKADSLVMGVDDKILSTYSADPSSLKWPYTQDNQMYIILNLAMGGTGGGAIEIAPSDIWRMEIASISLLKL